MRQYIIKYDHTKYKPSTHEQLKQQQQFKLIIEAETVTKAKETLRKEHNLNPFYFKIELK